MSEKRSQARVTHSGRGHCASLWQPRAANVARSLCWCTHRWLRGLCSGACASRQRSNSVYSYNGTAFDPCVPPRSPRRLGRSLRADAHAHTRGPTQRSPTPRRAESRSASILRRTLLAFFCKQFRFTSFRWPRESVSESVIINFWCVFGSVGGKSNQVYSRNVAVCECVQKRGTRATVSLCAWLCDKRASSAHESTEPRKLIHGPQNISRRREHRLSERIAESEQRHGRNKRGDSFVCTIFIYNCEPHCAARAERKTTRAPATTRDCLLTIIFINSRFVRLFARSD